MKKKQLVLDKLAKEYRWLDWNEMCLKVGSKLSKLTIERAVEIALKQKKKAKKC